MLFTKCLPSKVISMAHLQLQCCATGTFINVEFYERELFLLRDISVEVRGVRRTSVYQIQQDNVYTLLLMSLPITTCVYPAESVIGSLHRELINVGNCVQFTTGLNEVQLKLLEVLLISSNLYPRLILEF